MMLEETLRVRKEMEGYDVEEKQVNRKGGNGQYTDHVF